MKTNKNILIALVAVILLIALFIGFSSNIFDAKKNPVPKELKVNLPAEDVALVGNETPKDFIITLTNDNASRHYDIKIAFLGSFFAGGDVSSKIDISQDDVEQIDEKTFKTKVDPNTEKRLIFKISAQIANSDKVERTIKVDAFYYDEKEGQWLKYFEEPKEVKVEITKLQA